MYKRKIKGMIGAIRRAFSADRKTCLSGGCSLAATPIRKVMIATSFFTLLIGASCVTETNMDKQAEAAPANGGSRQPAPVVPIAAVAQTAPVGHTNTVHLDERNFQPTVARGVTIVDFWAPWCGPCRRQMPILDNVAQTLGRDATIAKVNVDNNSQLARRYGIQSIPALLIFKDGRLVRRFTGVQKADTLVNAVRTANGSINLSQR